MIQSFHPKTDFMNSCNSNNLTLKQEITSSHHIHTLTTHPQGKAFATIDTKGHAGPPGALVRALPLQVSNLTLTHTSLRPISLHNLTESPIILAALPSPFNYTTGNIDLSGVEVWDDFPRPWLSVSTLGPYSIGGHVALVSGSAVVHNKNGCVMAGDRVNVSVQCRKDWK